MKKRRNGRKIRNEAAPNNGVRDSCISALPQNSCFVEFLPTDLSQEIFGRLPCKDILSCKCVCRAWCKLLSHPNFTCIYTKNPPFKSLFFIQSCDDTNSVFLLEFAANGGVIKAPISPKIPDFQQLDLRLCVIGSCNGLLFLLKECRSSNRMVEKVYCCNPLLEGCIVLAEQERPYQSGDLWFVEYFIGYISSTNKFKLLRVVFEGLDEVEQADILTVGVDRKWRRVEDNLDLRYLPRGVSFNGAYLWIFEHENVRHLCTFDFGEEKSGWKSKLPDLLQHQCRIDLVVLNNCISVIDISDVSQVTVWTMEEYGVLGSWSRKIVIRDWYPYNPEAADLCAVGALPNGDILLSDWFSGNIMALNPEKEHTEIKFPDVEPFTATLHAAEFAPRFYSLKEDIRGTQYRYTRKVWSNSSCFVLLGSAVLFACLVILLIS